MSENYLGIITENYEWELSSENYHLVYHHAEKLRFIGILAYPKINVDEKSNSTAQNARREDTT